MKKYLYLIGCILAAAVISGCDKESGVGSEEEVRVTGTQYMPVNLVMPSVSGTRADSYDNQRYDAGTYAERAIDPKKSIFLFYDGAGNYLTHGTINTDDAELNADGTLAWDTQSSSSNRSAATKATVVLGATRQFPASVVAILNYDGDRMSFTRNTVSIDDLFTDSPTPIPTTSAIPGAAGTFLMSNSLYIDPDNDYRMVTSTEIPSGSITDSLSALGSPVDIYVEREVSKVRISAAETMETEVFNDTTKFYQVLKNANGADTVLRFNNNTRIPTYAKFRVVIDGWGVNATNSEGAVMKQYLANWESSGSPFIHANFNHPGYHRSYWGADANYTHVEGERYDPEGPAASTGVYHGLQYKSWNDITKAKEPCDTAAAYYHPNTAQIAGQHVAAGDTASVPTLLVAAHVQYCTSNSATSGFSDWQDFEYALYYNNGNYMNFEGMTSHLAVDLGDLGYYYSADPADAQADTSSLTREQISNLTFDDYPNAELNSGRVQIATITLAPTKTVNNAEYTLVKDGEEVTQTTLNGLVAEMNQLSCISAGTGVQRYDKGACYYQVPIHHWSATDDGSAEYYGLVRNHSYIFTIGSISKIGGPVNDKDDPLPVIPGDRTDYYIAARLNVLDWAVKDQGVIEL